MLTTGNTRRRIQEDKLKDVVIIDELEIILFLTYLPYIPIKVINIKIRKKENTFQMIMTAPSMGQYTRGVSVTRTSMVTTSNPGVIPFLQLQICTSPLHPLATQLEAIPTIHPHLLPKYTFRINDLHLQITIVT